MCRLLRRKFSEIKPGQKWPAAMAHCQPFISWMCSDLGEKVYRGRGSLVFVCLVGGGFVVLFVYFAPLLSTDCSMVILREFPSSTDSAVALHARQMQKLTKQEFCETLQSHLKSALKSLNEHNPVVGSFQSSSACEPLWVFWWKQKRGKSVSSKHNLVMLIRRLAGVKTSNVGVQLTCTFISHLTLVVVWIS